MSTRREWCGRGSWLWFNLLFVFPSSIPSIVWSMSVDKESELARFSAISFLKYEWGSLTCWGMGSLRTIGCGALILTSVLDKV